MENDFLKIILFDIIVRQISLEIEFFFAFSTYFLDRVKFKKMVEKNYPFNLKNLKSKQSQRLVLYNISQIKSV